MRRDHTSLMIMYGNPPTRGLRSEVGERMAEFLGWPTCEKCKRHYKPDEPCPFCARAAAQNYRRLIDIETGS